MTTPPAGPRTDACDTLGELAHEHFDRVVSNTVLPAHVRRVRRTTAPHSSPLIDSRLPRSRASTACGRTRPPPSTRCAPGGTSRSPPAPRRASRSATRSRSSRRVADRRARHRAPRVPDQGPRAGPAARASASWLRARRSWPRPTTATRPTDERAWVRAHANVLLTNPEMLHWASSRRTSGGRRSSCGCATSSSTSCTRSAASSAATSPTCSAGCAGCASTTAPTRRSASPARPSATRPSWRRRSAGCPVEAIDGDGSPQAERMLRAVAAPAASTPAPGARALGQRRDRRCSLAALRRRRAPDARLHPQPQGRRARRRRTPRRRLAGARADAAAVAAYRAGYLAAERRELEERAVQRRARRRGRHQRARARHRRRRRSTPCVLNGFPGTLASIWQQVGRAGRTGRRAAAVLVAGDDQLDQWYARHPDELLDPAAGAGGGQPGQPVRGSRPDLPAPPTSCRSPTPTSASSATRLDDGVRDLVLDDLLEAARRGGVLWAGREPPAARRRAAERLVGRVPARRRRRTGSSAPSTRPAPSSGAPGAIYLHQGRQYRVDRPRHRRTTSRSSSRPTTPTSTRSPASRPTSRSWPTEQSTPVGRGARAPRRGRGASTTSSRTSDVARRPTRCSRSCRSTSRRAS